MLTIGAGCSGAILLDGPARTRWALSICADVELPTAEGPFSGAGRVPIRGLLQDRRDDGLSPLKLFWFGVEDIIEIEDLYVNTYLLVYTLAAE